MTWPENVELRFRGEVRLLPRFRAMLHDFGLETAINRELSSLPSEFGLAEATALIIVKPSDRGKNEGGRQALHRAIRRINSLGLPATLEVVGEDERRS